MEYCLSTVKEFLKKIGQCRTQPKRSNGDNNTDRDDESSTDSHPSSPSLDADEADVDGHRSTPSLDVDEHVRGFVKQLLQALMVLHEQGIVHCDVKGDNVFIAYENGNYIVKLGVRSEAKQRYERELILVG